MPLGGPSPFKCVVTSHELRVRKRLTKKGIPFQPQKRIKTQSGRVYRVDIFVPPRIVVEIGYVGPEDIQEDEDLKASGYTVLRFKNDEVRGDIAAVIEQIRKVRV